MAGPTAPILTDKTFSKFTAAQGANYAKHRAGYSASLYSLLLSHHTSTGGQLGTLLDVGCGPGIATRGLSSHFSHAIGLDPSGGMISTARSIGGFAVDSPIRFEISTAEELGSDLSPRIEDASVDLITAATAAHWFDMPRFWPAAARVLKPGGSVAFWATGNIGVHPDMPNSTKIQEAMDMIQDRDLRPFLEPGNIMTRELYINMPLPWTLEKHVEAFDVGTYLRREWGPGDVDDFFEEGRTSIDLDTMEKMLGTAGPVQRWRDANADKVGTEEDLIRTMRRQIENLLWEAGVEKGKEVVKGQPRRVLMIFKKKL